MTPEVLARVPAKFHIDPCSVKASRTGPEGAASCGAYWFFKGCECKDTFQYCQAWRETDGSGRTLRERPVPKFFAKRENTADNVSDAWVNANNPSAWLGGAAFHHLARNATYPQVFHW